MFILEYLDDGIVREEDLDIVDLWKDLSDGIHVAKVILFYKPDVLSEESINLFQTVCAVIAW